MGIILRQNKGSELTFAEVDGNFQSLYYSSSLSASTLSFFFASSSLTHSIDISGSTDDVNQIIAGTNVTISPTDGKGIVTINAALSGSTDGIFAETGSYYATTNDLQITGSLINSGSFYLTGNLTASGNISSSDDIIGKDFYMKEYLYHIGDADTYLRFGTNLVNLVAGGDSAIKLDKSTNKIQINNSNANLDTQIMGDGGDVIFHVDAGGHSVGIATATPPDSGSATLTVSGSISASGLLYTSASLLAGQSYGVLVQDQSTGRIYYTGSYGSGGGATTDGIFNVVTGTIFGTTSSLQVTGSTIQQSPFTTTGANITASNAGTGGGTDKYALTVSESVWHYTDNVGVPTSKAWKTDLDGSYFNNFDHNTDTAEILRFISGLLSASAPDAAPNTRYYASLGVSNSNTGTVSAPDGYVPQSSTNNIINYLNSKGFADVGSTIFNGIGTIYNNISYKKEYSSVAGGSTIVSSSIDSQLFGLGAIGQAFNVSGSQFNKWANNSAKLLIESSASVHFLTKTGAGTTAGLTVGDIATSDPLIPQAYQDGKFEDIYDQILYNNGVSLASPSSSGYYYFTSSVGIQSGSSAYSTYFSQEAEIFWTPVADGDFTQTTSIGINGSASLTATSKSLSGAPLLSTSNWGTSASITGLFTPLYAASSTFARLVETDTLVTITDGGSGESQGSTSGGTVQNTNFIYESTGTTPRTIGTVPTQGDIVKLSGSISFNAGSSGAENITQTSITPTTFTQTVKGRDRSGAEATAATNTYEYFKAGTFGHDAASGSMAYYGRAQGYDGGTLAYTTSTTEDFTGEEFRIKIDDDLLSGSYTSGSHFVTSSYQEYVQDPLELQVKPGYLVEPGGTYGYWSPANGASGDYIYYARAFQRNLGTGAGSVTMSLGTTLQPWESATAGVSAVLLFQSSGIPAYATARIFDPTNTVDNVISSSLTNDGFKNPFTDDISLYGNVGGAISGNDYQIPLRNGDGMVLDGTDQDFIVIIRYKNDPTPVESISITTN